MEYRSSSSCLIPSGICSPTGGTAPVLVIVEDQVESVLLYIRYNESEMKVLIPVDEP